MEHTHEIKPVSLEERTGCCWPIGEKNFLFCNEVKDTKSKNGWCTYHFKIGTQPGYGNHKR